MSDRLADKVIVVTGAAGGIGRATVQRVLAEGASVAAVDLGGDGLDATMASVAEYGDRVLAIPADVAQEAQVIGYHEQAAARFGGIDGVFNNAGIEGEVKSFEEYPVEAFERVLAGNTVGVFLGIKHSVGYLRQRGGGAIVNTASTAGLGGNANLSAYVASKHAVIGLTRSASMAYAKENIRVNAICPAPIETRMMRSLEQGLSNDPDAVKRQFEQRIPAQRYGEPEEVAALVTFLLSNEASFTFGASYTIDGGMTPF